MIYIPQALTDAWLMEDIQGGDLTTRALGTGNQAIVAAGGLIHRAGCAETLLLFANHRRFLTDDGDWAHAIDLLRRRSPEKKVAVEADTPEEALAALRAQPDILQLDKFTPQQAREVSDQARHIAPLCTLALTGGMTLASLCQYLDCGIELFITSAPWYAPPADIQVRLRPDNSK